MHGCNPCQRAVMWKRQRVRKNERQERFYKSNIILKAFIYLKLLFVHPLQLLDDIIQIKLYLLNRQIACVRVVYGCRLKASHRNYHSAQLLNFSDIPPPVSNPVQSEDQGGGYAAAPLARINLLVRLLWSFFCEVTGRGFKIHRISVLCPLSLTFPVLKRVALHKWAFSLFFFGI